MKNVMKFFWSLFIALCSVNGYAQPNNWIMLNGEQYANNIFVKDSLVYVARFQYNGVSVVNLNQQNYDLLNQFNGKLPDDVVYQVLADSQNRVWIRNLKAITIRTGNTTNYYPASYFGVADNPNIGNMAIDRNQNVWFGLGQSLVKFDGQNFQVYDSTDCPMLNFWSGDLVVDHLNQVWLSSGNNMVKFDGINWSAYYGDTIGIAYPISNLRNDKLGNLFFLEGGSRLKKFNGSSVTQIHFFNGGSYCEEMEVDSLNNIWVLDISFQPDDAALLLKLNGSNWDTIVIDDPEIKHGISHFVPFTPDDIFMGTWEGVYRLSAGVYHRYLVNDTLLMNGGIGKVFTSPDAGKVWITSARGLIEWEGTNIRHYKQQGKYYNDVPANDYFVDRHDSLWVSGWTEFCRYSQWNDSAWGVECMDSTFPSSQIAFDTLNAAWTNPRLFPISVNPLVLAPIPLHYFNNDTIIYFPNITSTSALIATDSKNNLWVLNGDSLGKFDGNNWLWRLIPAVVSLTNPYPTFQIDFADNVYINYGSVLLAYDGTNFTSINVPDSFVLEKIVFSKDSSVWGVIYTQGLFTQHMKNFLLRYKNGVWDSLQIPVYENDFALIRDLAIDRYGNMWLVVDDDLGNSHPKIFIHNPKGLNHYLNTEQLSLISESKIYPNPCNDFFSFSFTAAKSERILLRIYDLTGALVFEDGTKRSEEGSNTLTYSIRNIHSGMYLTVVSSETYKGVKKLFVSGSE